ncbi:MAG TPA: long-chain fatty acid--CoA ligase [Blastocatellia bacterium]|nr:long-chain fatty acid--CoA ligase [Blastocatellia bacterium]
MTREGDTIREGYTINGLLAESASRFGAREFLRFRTGTGEWSSFGYNQVADKVKELTLGLHMLGFKAGDRIAIWSENRPEWNIADLAVLALGAVDVPIYTTQAKSQIEFILKDSATRAIFVSSRLLEGALELRASVPSIELLISFDELPVRASKTPDVSTLTSEESGSESSHSILNIDEVMRGGRAADKEESGLYDTLRLGPKPDDLATQIYTSGTTGVPKGVMLTHRNLCANVLFGYRWLKLEGRRDVALSYLPFSHIFERGTWYLYMHAGTVVAYAESLDTIARDMGEVHPTVMTSVPRMFEKMYARMIERGVSSPFPRRQILLWSLEVASQWAKRRNSRGRAGAWLSFERRIADLLVYGKLRQAVGGRIRCFISGGAPLTPEIAYVFTGAGIPILQGYGLTETSPSISCNTEEHNRIGTVGRVIDGVSVKIAADGEILVKGDTVTIGYYNSPDKNAQTFTADGWFCTGDIGYLDGDGYLVITDRKKDLIKTSGGKYIAPQRIESMLTSSRFVSQVVVIGNGRKFPSALIVPDMAALRSYASLKGIKYGSDAELIADWRVLDLLERQVEKYTPDLARFETIKKIALIEHEFTIDAGELTPTLKARRRFIEQKYAVVIDKLYDEGVSEVAAAKGAGIE